MHLLHLKNLLRNLSMYSAAVENLTKILLKADPTNFISHNNQVYLSHENQIMNEFKKRKILETSTSSTTSTTNPHQQHQPLNRTDVIHHAAILIEKLHQQAEEQKAQFVLLGHHHPHQSSSSFVVGKDENGNPVPATAPPFVVPQQVRERSRTKTINGSYSFSYP